MRILAAHGGGYLPFYLGRANHASRARPESRQMKLEPREYLKRIWFDTVVYESSAIRQLVDVVGESPVVLGIDYPFDMGSYDVTGLLSQVPGLSEKRPRSAAWPQCQAVA